MPWWIFTVKTWQRINLFICMENDQPSDAAPAAPVPTPTPAPQIPDNSVRVEGILEIDNSRNGQQCLHFKIPFFFAGLTTDEN